MRAGIEITVTPEDRRRLEAITRNRNTTQKHVARAKVILATADGFGTMEITRRSGLSKPVVWRWQERFMFEGVNGLLRDKTRLPGKPRLPDEAVRRVLNLTLSAPPQEATHWTGRMMASVSGVSLRSVQRIWAAHGLAPHRIRTFKLSGDPLLAEKLRDVVGLYVDPPANAIVLSVDEKSHVWMAPGWQEESGRCRRIACSHVSGLLLRPARPLAPMGVRGRSLIRSSGSRPFSSPGLSDPSMQPTTPSLSHASLFLADSVRRWRSAGTVLPSPSRPRRYGPFCWRAPPRPLAGRGEPEGSGSMDSPSPPSSATTLSALQ
jgi:transposase